MIPSIKFLFRFHLRMLLSTVHASFSEAGMSQFEAQNATYASYKALKNIALIFLSWPLQKKVHAACSCALQTIKIEQLTLYSIMQQIAKS